MKTILHVITGLNGGGAESVLTNLCQSLKYKHVIISLTNNIALKAPLENVGCKVFVLNTSLLNFFYSFYFIGLTIIKYKPFAIQSWMYHANFFTGIVCFFLNYKNLFWGVHHSYLDKNNSSKLTILLCRLSVYISFVPKKIIYCSDVARKCNEKFGFPKLKSVVIYNGFSTSKFKYQYPSFDNKSFKILHVGRFDRYKNHNFLFDVFNDFSNSNHNMSLELHCFGENISYSNELLLSSPSYINSKESIFLNGFSYNISEIYSQYDLLILTSTSESFGNVFVEAMLSGLPCLSFPVGEFDAISGSYGFKPNFYSVTSYVECLYKCYIEYNNYPHVWLYKSFRGREHVADLFNLNNFSNSYTELWSS